MQKNTNSQSTTSIDLNKFKIHSISYNSKNDYSKISLPNNNENFDNNSIQLQNIQLSSFKPYNVNTFLGKNKQNKNVHQSEHNTVNNISIISSNFKYLMHCKKLEEEQLLLESKDPVLAFKNQHQKESRRMILEFLKVSLLSENTPSTVTVQDLLEDYNISPFVFQKKLFNKK